MKFVVVIIKIFIGLLLAAIWAGLMLQDTELHHFDITIRPTISERAGHGVAAGLFSPFFVPNLLAYVGSGMDKSIAVLVSGFGTALFYSPFMVHWWIKRESK